MPLRWKYWPMLIWIIKSLETNWMEPLRCFYFKLTSLQKHCCIHRGLNYYLHTSHFLVVYVYYCEDNVNTLIKRIHRNIETCKNYNILETWTEKWERVFVRNPAITFLNSKRFCDCITEPTATLTIQNISGIFLIKLNSELSFFLPRLSLCYKL